MLAARMMMSLPAASATSPVTTLIGRTKFVSAWMTTRGTRVPDSGPADLGL
jgi:hypothetical protein